MSLYQLLAVLRIATTACVAPMREPGGDMHLGLIGPKLRFWPSCGTVPEQIDRIGIVA